MITVAPYPGFGVEVGTNASLRRRLCRAGMDWILYLYGSG